MHFGSPKQTDPYDAAVRALHQRNLRRQAKRTIERGGMPGWEEAERRNRRCRSCHEDGRSIFGRGMCQRCYRRWRRAQGLDKG